MENKIVKLVYPSKKKAEVKLSISKIPFSKDISIYETVEIFKEQFFKPGKIKFLTKKIKVRIPLKKVITLHNVDGIRDISQISSMLKQISSGKDIFSSEGLTNIKLVRSREKEWVLFDGHHSLLAYLLSGKKYLDEVPHLIVENEKRGYLEDEEIHIFFGEHAKKLKNKDWKNYVINWQAPKERQLQSRIQRNMGELLNSLSKFFQRQSSS